MLRIRLTRVGKKNSPAYRVVVADKRRAVKRKFIEIIGHYNPIQSPKEIVINKERALFWMQNGAQPSDTVNNLMCDLGILDKKEKVNKVFGKKLSKKAAKEGAGEKPAGQSPLGGDKEEAATEETSKTAEVTEAPAEEKAEEAKAEQAPAEEKAEEAQTEEAAPEKTEE